VIEDAQSVATLTLALAGGAVAGALHAGLLWLSVNQLIHGGRIWVFAAGALGRLALIVVATAWFLNVADGRLTDLAVAVVGFVAARIAATRLVKRGLEGR
jgi:F1F0 ATPase subunit 2